MKAWVLRRMLVMSASAGLLLSAAVPAQNDPYSYMAPALSSGAGEIVKLSQAKVSDDTIIAYIKNSGKNFYLNADQILYLRQQGVSEAVITAMLSLPGAGVAPSTVSPPETPPSEPAAGYGQAEPYYTTDNAPYYYYPYYSSYPAYGYYNWSYPFYWPYCWGGYWNGFWGGCWHGHPCFWHNGFCAWNGNSCVRHGGTVWHGNTVSRQGNTPVWHGNNTFWNGKAGVWNGNPSFRTENNGMWHGNAAFRQRSTVVHAPTSKIVWLDGAGALGSSPDSMRRNMGVLGGTPDSMQRNIGVLGSGPNSRGNAVMWHNNQGAWHGNANFNRQNSAPVVHTTPVVRGNMMSQSGGGGFVGKRR